MTRSIVQWWRNRHNCADHMEQANYTYYNDDPDAIPNPLSIYGPIGSYWIWAWRCTVCGMAGGKRHDTWGGFPASSREIEQAFAKGMVTREAQR